MCTVFQYKLDCTVLEKALFNYYLDYFADVCYFSGDWCVGGEDTRILAYMYNAYVVGEEEWAYRYDENIRPD